MKNSIRQLLRRYRKTAFYRLKLKFWDMPENYDPLLVNIPTEWGHLEGNEGVYLKAEDSPIKSIDATLIWCKFEPGTIFPEHYHLSYDEVVTVHHGHIVATLDGERLDLHPGDGFIAHAHQIHGYEAIRETLLALTFTPALLRNINGDGDD